MARPRIRFGQMLNQNRPIWESTIDSSQTHHALVACTVALFLGCGRRRLGRRRNGCRVGVNSRAGVHAAAGVVRGARIDVRIGKEVIGRRRFLWPLRSGGRCVGHHM
jgi:hypothetical protein